MSRDASNPTDEPPGESTSVWLATSEATDYDALEDGIHADTVIIGGGIAGLTTAFQLDQSGQSVVVLERDRILTGVTGYTTAKLTSLHGLVYDHLLDHFDEDLARQYADANEAAIDAIETTADALDVNCNFERTPAYTYTESADMSGQIREEVEAARQLGLPASYVESTELPFDVAAAIRFDDQAQFHPRRYLLALAREIDGGSSHVFEQTRATDIDTGRSCRVTTEHGQVAADDVVVATNFPMYDHAFYYARLYPKRSYVLGLKLHDDPPTGLYYDPSEPYLSVRPLPTSDGPMVLVGGQNHRTGHGHSTTERYEKLEAQAREHFDGEAWVPDDGERLEVPFPDADEDED
jgi:glycine/D-amino acid oxidase-like deaminating enzyme